MASIVDSFDETQLANAGTYTPIIENSFKDYHKVVKGKFTALINTDDKFPWWKTIFQVASTIAGMAIELSITEEQKCSL